MDGCGKPREASRLYLTDSERLAVLARTGLPDSEAEPSYDRLVRLAAKFLGAPVAIVSLVDADRQFFKSCVGLPEPWAGRRETPLTHSFCQHVVTTREALVIDDARTDPLVKDNLAIPDLGVVAYLGIPLVVNGHVIGSFCAIDSKPRVWSADDVAVLRDLAESVVTEIRLRADHRELERQRAIAEDARLRLDTALSAGSVATFTWDIVNDRVVGDVNMARLYSISPQDVEGGPVSNYLQAIHPDDREEASRAIGEAIANGDTFSAEYRVSQADGQTRWVVARGSVSRDDKGQPVRMSGVVVDTTERELANKTIRESEDRNKTLLDSMDEGFCIIEVLFDADGNPTDYRFLEVNPAFTRHTGLHQATGKRMRELAPGHEAHWFERYGNVATTGQAVRFENSATELGDRYFDVYAFRVGEPEQRRVAVFFKDITDHTRAEKERERLVEQLRDADKRKSDFLAMLAHELRNPLAAITNASTLMSMTDKPDTIEYCKETIGRQTKHLSRLIDDLLDVSRINQGKIDLLTDRMEATPAIESAVQTVKPLVDERKHTLDVRLDRGTLWVNADATRIEQVVINLLNNAAKYSENGGHIWLTACREGDEIVIRVKDAGVGIAPEKLPEMFELFAQADRSSARSEGGLGIGLTLVKSLVEMHGGVITASSEGLGKGSEFVVRLPAVTPPAAVAVASVAKGPSDAMQPVRILVVDDNADTARSMARLLKLMGHHVTTAHSGPEAIDAASAHPPEVVLLDIGLPGMDGLEVAKRLRTLSLCENAVIVAVSGYSQEGDRRRSREAGFDHHLAKPIDIDVLRSILSQSNR